MRMITRFKNWRQTEAEKLAPMSFGKKVRYILYYYRFWIVGLVILVCMGLYVGDAVYQSRREIVLQGFFTNDDYGLFDAGAILDGYTSGLTLDKSQRVVFDDVLYIDLEGGATDYTSASNGKIIAYIVTSELDFVVTSVPVFQHFATDVPMADFRALLPADLLEQIGPGALIELAGADGKTGAWGLDMSGSRFVRDSGVEAAKGFYVLFVPRSAPNQEQLVDFIRYSFAQ